MAFLVLLLLLCAQEPWAQGFAEQLKAAQQAQQAAQQAQQQATPQEVPEVPTAEPKSPEPKPVIVEKKAETPPPKKDYPFYEAYLDSIELIAKSLLPARLTLDSMKYVINSETPSPMSQYEKKENYERRIANAEKNKLLKIATLEKQHSAKEKKIMDKLTAVIKLNQDIQPEWDGMLQENGKETEEYRKRINKFKEKISDMNVMSARVNSLLEKLSVNQSDVETLEKKNLLYIKRMERACELMQNYMLKEEAQILTTERKKFDMVLRGYDVDKEEFQVNVKDFNSNVPFDFHGVIKIQPRLAEEIDNETDDFTTSIDYVNYPFTADGAKVYPGAKKAHIYYEDKEVYSVGAFKNIGGLDWREGYSEWASHADSLLSGKLKYKNLDSSYAMKKVRVGPPFWTATRIFRATAFTLSAASLGLGIWQHSTVKDKTKKANELYSETLKVAIEGEKEIHSKKAKAYDDKVNSLQNSQIARNCFYFSAGAFGVAGIMSFFF